MNADNEKQFLESIKADGQEQKLESTKIQEDEGRTRLQKTDMLAYLYVEGGCLRRGIVWLRSPQ